MCLKKHLNNIEGIPRLETHFISQMGYQISLLQRMGLIIIIEPNDIKTFRA